MARVQTLSDGEMWEVPLPELLPHTLDATEKENGQKLNPEYVARARAVYNHRSVGDAIKASAKAARWAAVAAIASCASVIVAVIAVALANS